LIITNIKKKNDNILNRVVKRTDKKSLENSPDIEKKVKVDPNPEKVNKI
jgi:hypothetical protein